MIIILQTPLAHWAFVADSELATDLISPPLHARSDLATAAVSYSFARSILLVDPRVTSMLPWRHEETATDRNTPIYAHHRQYVTTVK